MALSVTHGLIDYDQLDYKYHNWMDLFNHYVVKHLSACITQRKKYYCYA